VDVFLGASEMDRLIPALEERGVLGDPTVAHPGVRAYAGDLPHVRYLKISEGCDHGCAFCAIPLMRGRHRSFSRDEIVHEARILELQGALEVNLVAQDLAHYGRDRRDDVRLPELLESLIAETSIPWFRLLYLYSTGMTPRLLETLARESRILKYLDMPIQHASDAVLARMRRPERQRTIRDRVRRVRGLIPGISIRTTCIVGFPGETEDDFHQLLDFLDETQFDRVGAFTYSAQEGTRAHALADDVPEPVKRERLERLTELQRIITSERYERHVGRPTRVLVDRAGRKGVPAEARAPWQADDIDGVVRIAAPLAAGRFADVMIDGVEDDYDFRATLVTSVDAVVAPRRSWALPVTTGTIGSFGR